MNVIAKTTLIAVLVALGLAPTVHAEEADSLYVLSLQHARNEGGTVGIPLQVWMECRGTTIVRTLRWRRKARGSR